MENFPFKSVEVWLAVAIALLVKIKTSAQFGWKAVSLTAFVAVGSAGFATEFTAVSTGLPEPIAAALVTLTAEGIMRWILIAINNPKEAIDLWKYWRKP